MAAVIDDYDVIRARLKEIGHDYPFAKPDAKPVDHQPNVGWCSFCREERVRCDGGCRA